MQPAGVVVLAAYAAETPRIMFNSATDKHPKGLANSNDLVGKYLMCHSAANVWALFDEDIQNYMGTPGQPDDDVRALRQQGRVPRKASAASSCGRAPP